MEKWKQMTVTGIPTLLMISNNGRVKDKDGNILTPNINDKGYHRIFIGKSVVLGNVQPRYYLLHRLVLENFSEEGYMETMTGDHINKDKNNNGISNLRWLTVEDNSSESHKFGRDYPKGDTANNVKYTAAMIHLVCELLECQRYSRNEISNITGVSLHTIDKIKSKNQWTIISNMYDIPDTKPHDCPITIYDQGLKDSISHIIIDRGITSTKKIIEILGLEYNDKTRMMVTRVAKKIESSSTTRRNENL